MAAVATFDPDGLWLSTSVCEGAACPAAAAVGVRWGSWAEGLERADADLDRSKALTDLRRRLGAHVTERVRLTGIGYDGAHPRPQELVSEDAVACVFLQGTALLSARTLAGFTGLLCDCCTNWMRTSRAHGAHGKNCRKKAAIGAHCTCRSPARAGTPFAPLDD